MQQLTCLTAAPLTSLKVICSCKVPVSFFFWTLLSLTPLPYTEAQTAILCPPDVKNWLIEKDPDTGKIEGRIRWLDYITDSMDMSLSKFWVGDGQGGLACCSPRGGKESDTTERLNWTEDETGFGFSLQSVLEMLFLTNRLRWVSLPVSGLYLLLKSLGKKNL